MKLSKPQAILFDWDNTLVEGWKRIGYALNSVFKEYNIPIWSDDEVKQRAHRSAREVFPLFFGDKAQEALDFFYSKYHGYEGEQLVLDGAKELLDYLEASGVYTAVISNKHGNSLRNEVEEKQFTKYFSKVIGAKDAEEDKPSSAPVKLALDGSGISLGSHVWIVGDSTIDMICAKNSEASPILYGDKIAAHEIDSQDIDYHHVPTHADLLKLLRRHS
jgi:phosphoglycolate phosphatase